MYSSESSDSSSPTPNAGDGDSHLPPAGETHVRDRSNVLRPGLLLGVPDRLCEHHGQRLVRSRRRGTIRAILSLVIDLELPTLETTVVFEDESSFRRGKLGQIERAHRRLPKR